jgi:hypothetical protein
VNRLIKSFLIVLGLGLVGYALYFKTVSIHSPQSARENSLLNAARQGEDTFVGEFRQVMSALESGWNVVIIAGAVIVLVAGFINAGPKKSGPP